jgi:hypothetical protein
MAILAKESSDNFARIMTGSQTYFETGRVHKDTPDRHPIDACALHANLGRSVFMQHFNQLFQVRSKHSDLVLKQNTFFVENAHKNANFVHIKSTYYSPRL